MRRTSGARGDPTHRTNASCAVAPATTGSPAPSAADVASASAAPIDPVESRAGSRGTPRRASPRCDRSSRRLPSARSALPSAARTHSGSARCARASSASCEAGSARAAPVVVVVSWPGSSCVPPRRRVDTAIPGCAIFRNVPRGIPRPCPRRQSRSEWERRVRVLCQLVGDGVRMESGEDRCGKIAGPLPPRLPPPSGWDHDRSAAVALNLDRI